MSRQPTPEEVNLTLQDQAFKHMIIEEVEEVMRRMAPELVNVLLEARLGTWIDEVVVMMNDHDVKIERLIRTIEGATDDEPNDAEPV